MNLLAQLSFMEDISLVILKFIKVDWLTTYPKTLKSRKKTNLYIYILNTLFMCGFNTLPSCPFMRGFNTLLMCEFNTLPSYVGGYTFLDSHKPIYKLLKFF